MLDLPASSLHAIISVENEMENVLVHYDVLLKWFGDVCDLLTYVSFLIKQVDRNIFLLSNPTERSPMEEDLLTVVASLANPMTQKVLFHIVTNSVHTGAQFCWNRYQWILEINFTIFDDISQHGFNCAFHMIQIHFFCYILSRNNGFIIPLGSLWKIQFF